MSYDLNILSINQERVSKPPFISSIELRNEIDSVDAQRYYSIWPFMSNSKGVWYSLGKDEDGWFNAMSIVDACFDEHVQRKYIPYWVSDDEVISNLKPLIVYNEYKSEFEKIIKFLIQQSPNRSIMFLARYQGGEKEIIYGVLKRQEFVKLLSESKILFNICYIINE
ncbi:hypothetical protein [Clostridium saccharoperbutylacetonicum]|uniref:hypothetical protein n=1 Tax=Clostridium saccharoperbutylacetonicum TaxID=36745 RepID=UPI00098405C1|nr:hypothetical protein [Clostridium saccharoperbutylacetonicum]AQR93125.1 hypothetical protein CLSAP_04020 [Clostridium saccharoperbutylacetonicum]NSB34537.1 hypothetical protein [Clostridium saccharoperbutylacetonicum]